MFMLILFAGILIIVLAYVPNDLLPKIIQNWLKKVTEYLIIHDLETIAVLVSVIVLLYFIRLEAGQRVGIRGIELSKIQDEIEKLRIENTELRTKVLDESSLTKVEQKAKASGFIPETQIYYLKGRGKL